MNRSGTSGLWWGLLLVVGGVLWLLEVTDTINIHPFVVAMFFFLAGVGFAFDFVRSEASWWAAMPAGALLGLGALIAFVEGTQAAGEWGAAMLLASTGIGFGAVYFRSSAHWWTLIPAGMLVAVALIVASVPFVKNGPGIAVIVLGILAAALVAFALIPIRGRRMLWALVPAAVLGVVAGFLGRGQAEVLEPYNWVAPVVLLVVGLVVLARMMSGRGADRPGS
jgi:hypothetical protein